VQSQKHAFVIGQHTLTLETGAVARQANASVIAQMGETIVMANVTSSPNAEPKDFFPLAVHNLEPFYAGGKLPGGYIKRETKPSEREVLISRLIDRSVRPLFPKGFCHDVNVFTKTLSYDPSVDPDIIAMIAASAALTLSDLPFLGPIGAVRVGLIENELVLNPNLETQKNSQLDLVVAGSKDAIIMVEAGAKGISEDRMLDAIDFAHKHIQAICSEINEFQSNAGKDKVEFQADDHSKISSDIEAKYGQSILDAFQVLDKAERKKQISEVAKSVKAEFESLELPDLVMSNIIDQTQKKIIRSFMLNDRKRIDGRDFNEVRPITIHTNTLPRAHGDSLFTRGQTQAYVVMTLGSERDAQSLDQVTGEDKQRFMLHYNFPPYCVGEVGMLGAPKRREIGHGRLARRALEAVIPSEEQFPYVVRLVSEITESNGSSSMASICGGTMAMMAGGVPISAPVAGIAMGLVKIDEQYKILSDISGDEDHFGHMDFKVAGTENMITALQMDIKITGLTRDILKDALEQAKEGRLHILKTMQDHLPQTSADVSRYAPRVMTFSINPDKIRDVIGKGGATIREITEKYEVSIDINDNGVVKINAVDLEKGEAAKTYIQELTADLTVGQIYEGKIIKMMDFGAVVSLLPGKDGFLHISQIANERIENIHDVLSEGQLITVKVVEVDRQNRVKVSMKDT
jgi:polyribonucleotide nucleotidyltransferase